MNAMLSRELLSQIVIILAVCVGGWMMIVGPKLNELTELRAAFAEAGANLAPGGQQAIEQMAERMQTVRARLGEIDAKNRFAQDSSQMYGLIMDLADEHGVVVQQLDPERRRRTDDDEASVNVTTLDLTVHGGYEQTAVFLSELDSLGGFLRPRSLNVTPREDDGRRFAEAQFSCEVVSFALPESLAAIVGADHVDE